MSSTTHEAIEQLVIAWANRSLPTTFKDRDGTPRLHFMWQNAPRPAVPYLSVNTFGQLRVGQAEERDMVETGPVDEAAGLTGWSVEIVSQKRRTLSLQAFGRTQRTHAREAHDALEVMQDSLELPRVVDLFDSCGFSFIDDQQVIDSSISVGAEIEDRASLDLFIANASVVLDDVGIIESVGVKGSFKDHSGADKPNLDIELTVSAT